MLPVIEFAMNNSIHASTGYTPFYVNGLAHPRVPLTLPLRGSGLGGGGDANRLAEISPGSVNKQVRAFLATRFSVLRHVRDAMAESQDKQKQYADANSRSCIESYEVGDQVLLSTKNLPTKVVSSVFKTKLRPRFIGPFTVVAKKGLAYTLHLPRKMRTHPVFYVGLLKPYRDPVHVDVEALAPRNSALPKGTIPEVRGPLEPRFEPPSAPAQGADFDFESQSHRDLVPSESGRRELSPRYRPPPALLDEHGNPHFHVERVLRRRRRQGQTQYLVKWKGYPESENSWEFEIPLRQDCPYAVDAFERRAHGHSVADDASH